MNFIVDSEYLEMGEDFGARCVIPILGLGREKRQVGKSMDLCQISNFDFRY